MGEGRERRNLLLSFGAIGAEACERIETEANQVKLRRESLSKTRGRRPKPDAAIPADVVRLLEDCATNGIPPPHALIQLVAQCLQVDIDEPALNERQARAARKEASYFRKHGQRASAELVAQAADATDQAVYNWRKDPAYLDAVAELLGDVRLILAWHAGVPISLSGEAKPGKKPKPTKTMSLEDLTEAVRDFHQENPGAFPMRSPVDGQVYSTPAEYAKHLFELLQRGYALPDEFPESKRK